jgi:hypothetical protein
MNLLRHLWHARWRRAAALLAADVLDGAEYERARAHVEQCGPCRAELEEFQSLLAQCADERSRTAQPGLPLSAFVTRVEARLNEPAASTWLWTGSRMTLATALGLAVIALTSWQFWQSRATREGSATTELLVPDDALRHIGRSLAREQTARYLSDAQDVLVTVASTLPHCQRRDGHIAVATEAQRSRDLLARRAVLVDLEAEHLAPAESVLMDVERALRDVAELHDCVSAADVARVQRQLDEQHLLMRIALVERELQG